MSLHKDMQHREQAGRIRIPSTVLQTCELTVTAEMCHTWQHMMKCRDGQLQDLQEGQAKNVRKNMSGQGPEQL